MALFGLVSTGSSLGENVSVEMGGSSDVHTLEHPYCDDLGCLCHTDVDYHDHVTGSRFAGVVDADLLDSALVFLGGIQGQGR